MNKFAKTSLVAIALVFAQAATTSAFAATPDLPSLHQQGAVTYLSGGVGSDQAAAIRGVMHKYPLVLEFAGATHQGNEYLADVPVHITNMKGATVLKATANGPFMLASLPTGRYKITASYDGKAQERVVNVSSSGHLRTLFVWQTHSDRSAS